MSASCQQNPDNAGAPQGVVLAIGPEGGWTLPEVKELESVGFIPFSLGRRVLRCEVALIFLLGQLQLLLNNPKIQQPVRDHEATLFPTTREERTDEAPGPGTAAEEFCRNVMLDQVSRSQGLLDDVTQSIDKDGVCIFLPDRGAELRNPDRVVNLLNYVDSKRCDLGSPVGS